MNRKRIILLAAFLSACDPSSVETLAVVPGCPLPPLVTGPVSATQLLVDDLEDGDRLGIAHGGLAGDWEIWDDETAKPTVQVVNRCAAVGRYAMHISTTGQTDWGATANLFFAGPKGRPAPFDATGWNGISFFMALSPNDSVERNFRPSVSTMETAWNGRCTSCVDNFGKAVWVTGRWQRYVLRFADLQQQGWGMPAAVLKLNEIVQFHLSLGRNFDVWLDHVQLERFDADMP